MKPRVLFVYSNYKEPMDGLHAAINSLGIEKHNLKTDHGLYPDLRQFSFVLGHGAFGSDVDRWLQNPPNRIDKMGLCVGGNATPIEGADKYDVLFYETDWINDNYLPKHPNKRKAFGVNTDLFNEVEMSFPIVWDYIGVGSFATWKHWDKMLQKKGNRLVVGEYQRENEAESLGIARTLLINGVMVSNQVNPLDLSLLYHYSRTLYMPSDIYGGGERSVLEARACGLQVEIEDNPKLQELINLPQIPTHFDYAKALKNGILSVI